MVSISRFSNERLILAWVAGLMLVLVLAPAPVFAAGEGSTNDATNDATSQPRPTFEEQVEAVWNRDLFLGDWEGWRTALQDHGLDPQFRLSQYGQWVAHGGIETNGAYGGTMDYRLGADLEKLFGLWEGLSISLHARTRFGQDVNGDAGTFALPNAGMLMPKPGNYDATDMTGFVVSQNLPFFGGRVANISLGKLDVIDTVTSLFPGAAFGQEGFWNVNAFVSAMPWFGAVNGLSVYGGMVSTINMEYQAAESGFLAMGTENVSTNWNSVQDSFDDGVWLAGFHRLFWKLEDKPGYFMLFGGYSTREQPSNDPRDFAVIPGQGITSTKEKNPWDIALYLNQVIWQSEDDPDRKATFMIAGTIGGEDPQFIQYNFFTNVEAFGPMSSRPRDRMGVAFWYNWLSHDFEDLVKPIVNLRDTYGFELYYNIAINKWLHVSPDLQFIKNERNGDDLAVIPGVRAVIDF